MNIAVVIANWNGAERLRQCLPSLFKQTYEQLTVVVVDNGSRDESAELLEKVSAKHDNFIVLRNATNLGFTGGVNTGIRWALAHNFEAVALLNDDAVADKDWIKELASVLDKKPDVGIATGLLLHADGETIDGTGDWLTTWGLTFSRNRGDQASEAPEAGYIFSASGGASLHRSSVFKSIGIFDDRYFAYYEDTDISFRTQMSGQKVFYTPEAVAYHGQGETSKAIPGFTVQQTFRNLPVLIAKNVPTSLFWLVLPRFFLAYGLFLANAIKRGDAGPSLNGWLRSFGLVIDALLYSRGDVQRQRNISIKAPRDMLWPDLPPDQTRLRKFRAFFIRSRES